MPFVKLGNSNIDDPTQKIIDWCRMCRAALYHAEEHMLAARSLVEQGKTAREILRAGSHHMKKARECFNSAVDAYNSACQRRFKIEVPEEKYPPEYERENPSNFGRAVLEELED